MSDDRQSTRPQVSSGQAFEKVFLLTGDSTGSGGIGTLTAYPGRLEFESKQARITLPDVREIAFEYEKVQAGALQRSARVRVTHGTGADLSTTYVAKSTIGLPRKVKEANEAFAAALQVACRTAPLSDADREAVAQSTTTAKARDFDAQMRVGRTRMWISAAVFVIGALVTLISYSAAEGGGHYVVAWGAMVFGALFFIAGAIDYGAGRKAKERAGASRATER
jgi:hypothetical protein